MSDEEMPGDRKVTPPVMGAMPQWAAELSIAVKSGFAHVNERLVAMDANIDLQGDTTRDVAKRMTALEERQNTIEARLSNHSDRAKAAVLTDDKHDAAIALLNSKLDINTSKTEQVLAIAERLDKVAAHPMVRRVAYAVGLALLAWLAAHSKGLM